MQNSIACFQLSPAMVVSESPLPLVAGFRQQVTMLFDSCNVPSITAVMQQDLG